MRERPDELLRIASTVELADGLTLIFIVGPDFRAEEGLALVRAGLPPSRPALWHRLDREGPDVVSAVERAGVRDPILLVHGLEYLGEGERATTEASMNMLRDRLATLRAAIILWVPRSDLESFQRHCADLFAWRSLLVSVTEEQVPIDSNLEAKRSYLTQLQAELRSLVEEKVGFEMQQPEALIERRVLPAHAQASIPLQYWAGDTQSGLLSGEAGSGKTTLLIALALNWAKEAILGNRGAPTPLLVNARDVYTGPLFGLDLDRRSLPRLSRSLALFPFSQARAAWAKEGSLALLLDGLDELARDDWHVFTEWLEQLRALYPRLKMIVAVLSHTQVFGPHWQRAQLEPMSLSQWRQHLGVVTRGRQQLVMEAVFQGMEELLRPSAAVPALLVNRLCHFVSEAGVSALSPVMALKRAIATLIQQARPFLGGTWHPLTLNWLLPSLAFHTLTQEMGSFSRQDVLDALDSRQRSTRALGVSRVRIAGVFLQAQAAGLPWLFTEAGPERYCFTYPFFRTFFAAEWLSLQGPHAAAHLVSSRLDQEEWREVVPLAAALMARNRSLPALLFLSQVLQSSAFSNHTRMRRLALVLDGSRAARLPPQNIVEWREQAAQLSQAAVHSEEEQTAQQELREALSRLEGSSKAS